MTDESDNEAWKPPETPASPPEAVVPSDVAAQWSPPAPDGTPPAAVAGAAGSSLAPPPPPPAPDVVSTGLIEAAPARRPRWFGRGVALGAAALLVGGGGYLAINAGSSDGGAETPQAALEGVLDSLSAEDIIGAAEFVEPVERETMIDAGIEIVEELVRLDIFDDSLNLGSVDGIDLEFSNLEIDVTEVRPGLAHIFLDSGRVRVTVDGSEFPLGSLITDRIDAETLDRQESTSSRIEPTDVPIVAVQRDGRWYLSLWYSVAENARLALDEPLPDPADRPVAIGGDTPELTIEMLIGAATDVDLATMIGLLDPQEAAALYDYAPLFLDEAQDSADDALEELRRQGWQWAVTDLRLSSESSGALSTVFVDGLSFEASGPEGSVEADYSATRSRFWFESDGDAVEIIAEGDCVSMTFVDSYETQNESYCTSDIAEEAGLEALTSGAFANLQSLSTPGIVVREVGGRWYVSPLRTGAKSTIDVLRNIEPDTLAETVDALIDFARDPFAFGTDPFESSDFTFDDDFAVPEFNTTTTSSFDEFDFPEFTEANRDLLSPDLEYFFVYDFVDSFRSDPWFTWLTFPDEMPFGEGVLANAFLGDESYVDVVVMTEIPFESDQAFADWLGAALVVDGDLTYVRAETDWGTEFVAARSGDGIVLIGLYDGFTAAAVDALRTQLDL